MKIKNARIATAAALATEAFWKDFASHFPEIASGDFPPDASASFDWAVTKATGTWIENNEPPHTLNRRCFTCYTNRIQTLRIDSQDRIWLKCSKCNCERILNLDDLADIK